MKVRSICLGCKVNTYESEYIISKFLEREYEISDIDPDIIVINTCSVTNQADAKGRKIINRCRRENPNSIIVIMGCMVESIKKNNPEEKEFFGANIVIGNKDKSKVVDLVEEYLDKKEANDIYKQGQMIKLYPDFDREFEDMTIETMEGRTRAFVKIQDGCQNFCSYCIIPYTRGKCRSKDFDKVINECITLVKNGYKEIVLTGIHTGHYGEDTGITFSSLLCRVAKIPGLERIRISSIEITELGDDFLEVLKNNPNIVDHIHIPLQAGSDHILELMNRKYRREFFKNKINEIRSIRPNISITTDIIVGFPGETEEDFIDTINFSKEIGFTKIHVFPYSRRKGTVADTMPNQIDERVKKERVERLLQVSDELENAYFDSYIGKEVEVLIETVDDYSIGHTGNYLKVKIMETLSKNTMYNVIIKSRDGKILIGERNGKN